MPKKREEKEVVLELKRTDLPMSAERIMKKAQEIGAFERRPDGDYFNIKWPDDTEGGWIDIPHLCRFLVWLHEENLAHS